MPDLIDSLREQLKKLPRGPKTSTVRDLIEELHKFPQNSNVVIVDGSLYVVRPDILFHKLEVAPPLLSCTDYAVSEPTPLIKVDPV
jgi:hypothetical protein